VRYYAKPPEVNPTPSKRKVKEWEALIEHEKAIAQNYGIVLRDLLFGDVERGGERFTVGVKAGEWVEGRSLKATVLRPLGGWPLVLLEIREGESRDFEVWPVDEFTKAGVREPMDVATLREMVRRAYQTVLKGAAGR
jgi:hypothetical protein